MRVAIIAAMGFCGAILRFYIGEVWGTTSGFPLSTLIINITGCFILGWFYTLSIHQVYVHPLLRLGIGTGFLGAFTTFSAFVVETWKLMDTGLYGMAETYVFLTIGVGLAFAWLGTVLGNWQSGLRFRIQARGR